MRENVFWQIGPDMRSEQQVLGEKRIWAWLTSGAQRYNMAMNVM